MLRNQIGILSPVASALRNALSFLKTFLNSQGFLCHEDFGIFPSSFSA